MTIQITAQMTRQQAKYKAPSIKQLALGIMLASGLVTAPNVFASAPTAVNSQITDAVTHANTTELATEVNSDLRDVIVVGNNWDGTIDIYDPHTHQRIKKLNAVPDKEER
jgi:hypothetical protein